MGLARYDSEDSEDEDLDVGVGAPGVDHLAAQLQSVWQQSDLRVSGQAGGLSELARFTQRSGAPKPPAAAAAGYGGFGCGAGPIPFGMAPPPPPPRTAYLGTPLGASASTWPKPVATPVAAAGSRGGAAQQPAYVGFPCAVPLGASQPPGYDPLLMNLLLHQFQQMQQIQKDRDEDGAEGVVGGGRAYRRLHKMKRRIEDRPMELITESLGDVRLRLGAEAGDPWQLWHMTNEISWQRNMGLKRTHWYVSHAVGYLIKGQHKIGTAYLCQFLRALHQSAVEQGDWTTACLMMPGHDPCGRDPYGCAEEDLHVIAA